MSGSEMDRRSFVKTTAAAATVAAAPVLRAQAKAGNAKSAKRSKPNVLYVFSDQHRAASLPGEPFNEAQAPTLAEFRRQNLSMDRCVSNYPLCTPYRGILLSGRWPAQTGLVYNNVPLSPKEVALGSTFQAAGYHTGYIGKWHLAGGGESPGFIPPGPRRMGFEDWHVWDSTNLHYHAWTYNPETGEKIFPEGWQPTRMTDEALTFLQAQDKTKPWMLVVSYNPPHPPYNPPPAEMALYPPDSLKLRPNVMTHPGDAEKREAAQYLASTGMIQQALQGYNGAITGIDKEFARILKALDDAGMADDTVVVYTSDHGEMMGSHGRMQKQVPFEESCRVPFMVRYPGVTPKGKSDALFAAVDIYPTLCGLAGIPVPAHCVGHDLSPLMRGQTIKESEMVFLLNQLEADGAMTNDAFGREVAGQASRGPNAPRGRNEQGDVKWVNQPSYRGVRTKTHTYAVALSGKWLLYDNVADPFQMKNLVNDPAQKGLMETLDAAIVQWLQSTGDAFPYASSAKKISSFPS